MPFSSIVLARARVRGGGEAGGQGDAEGGEGAEEGAAGEGEGGAREAAAPGREAVGKRGGCALGSEGELGGGGRGLAELVRLLQQSRTCPKSDKRREHSDRR